MTSDELRAYLAWLAPQTGTETQRGEYSGLLHCMMQKEFVMLVPWDDNRIADGLSVRKEFLRETGFEVDLGPCSVLEVLVGLSRRLAFLIGGPESGWAWQLICNLNLHKMTDPFTRRKANITEDILDDLVWRNYDPDGNGGFFPLIDTDLDQRKVEIWYQMAAYAEELIHTNY